MKRRLTEWAAIGFLMVVSVAVGFFVVFKFLNLV